MVIVMPHWGPEYVTSITSRQRRWARAMVRAGADVVLGAHSHVAGPIEMVDGVPVLYSLGDLLFDLPRFEATEEAFLAELTFQGGRLAQLELHPTVIVDRSQVNLLDPSGDGRVVLKRIRVASNRLRRLNLALRSLAARGAFPSAHPQGQSRSARTSARWRARRPDSASIWVRQLKPSARSGASGSAVKAGMRASSATAREMASWPRSAPKLPARPQQPVSSAADLDAVARQHAPVGGEAEDGLLVAVRLGDGQGLGRSVGTVSAVGARATNPTRRGAPRAWSPVGPGRRCTRIVREELAEVLAQHRGAGGLEDDDGLLAAQLRRTEGATQHAAGHVQLSSGVPGEAAADRPPGNDDLEAGGLEHAHRGLARPPASGTR